jgi:hypothetical protein
MVHVLGLWFRYCSWFRYRYRRVAVDGNLQVTTVFMAEDLFQGDLCPDGALQVDAGGKHQFVVVLELGRVLAGVVGVAVPAAYSKEGFVVSCWRCPNVFSINLAGNSLGGKGKGQDGGEG